MRSLVSISSQVRTGILDSRGMHFLTLLPTAGHAEVSRSEIDQRKAFLFSRESPLTLRGKSPPSFLLEREHRKTALIAVGWGNQLCRTEQIHWALGQNKNKRRRSLS